LTSNPDVAGWVRSNPRIGDYLAAALDRLRDLSLEFGKSWKDLKSSSSVDPFSSLIASSSYRRRCGQAAHAEILQYFRELSLKRAA
jgi:hypothetical protein